MSRDSTPAAALPLAGRRLRIVDVEAVLTTFLSFLFAGVLIFGRLGSLPLLDPDEGRNAEVAREMATTGRWLVPTYNGLPYLDKPALYFGLVAVSLKSLGNSELAARLPSAFFALALLVLVYRFSRREYGTRAGALAVVIVAAMPLFQAFVNMLEGPFALALWDPVEDKLVLARDRAGERPLFYYEGEHEVIFATELSALARDRGARCGLDRRGLQHYLRFGRFPAPLTPLDKIRKLSPGEIVCFGADGRLDRTYWRWALGATRRPQSVDGFDDVFVEAVRRQTDCDADFGIFLSGGIDSALVAAVARRLHPERKLRSYTVRFREASYDEGAAAMAVAERLDLEPENVWVRAEDYRRRSESWCA